ncbi:hypothetical protein EDC01DRAFT_634926 [Geopyxis carbonaria]|nr:hypothetical protein EDC01DRAFT_634926 [Geopyxis carbonaria]
MTNVNPKRTTPRTHTYTILELLEMKPASTSKIPALVDMTAELKERRCSIANSPKLTPQRKPKMHQKRESMSKPIPAPLILKEVCNDAKPPITPPWDTPGKPHGMSSTSRRGGTQSAFFSAGRMTMTPPRMQSTHQRHRHTESDSPLRGRAPPSLRPREKGFTDPHSQALPASGSKLQSPVHPAERNSGTNTPFVSPVTSNFESPVRNQYIPGLISQQPEHAKDHNQDGENSILHFVSDSKGSCQHTIRYIVHSEVPPALPQPLAGPSIGTPLWVRCTPGGPQGLLWIGSTIGVTKPRHILEAILRSGDPSYYCEAITTGSRAVMKGHLQVGHPSEEPWVVTITDEKSLRDYALNCWNIHQRMKAPECDFTIRISATLVDKADQKAKVVDMEE